MELLQFYVVIHIHNRLFNYEDYSEINIIDPANPKKKDFWKTKITEYHSSHKTCNILPLNSVYNHI